MKLNVFVKLNEQKTNKFVLCHSEKTPNEIEQITQFMRLRVQYCSCLMQRQILSSSQKSSKNIVQRVTIAIFIESAPQHIHNTSSGPAFLLTA